MASSAGLSPRSTPMATACSSAFPASQYLILGAKAFALMDGRAAPEAADVRRVAPAVLAHRIVPNYRATDEGLKAIDLVSELVKEVPEPRY